MTASDLSADRIHDLLAAGRRRYTLYCLYMYANPIRLSDVAGQIVEWEYDAPADERLDERLAIYTSLYHIHVPKLAEADVVAYDRSDELIELGPNAEQIRPYLEQAAEIDLDETDLSPL
ncbi:DUF7344 domain-containing protein [Haloarcula salina]|uniref:DUF7344 domain-containing protein n=1 Tax=Haloarcula salina TaxID=1429914 RepID=A0AA41G271_9EURY|nr:hypothetical protein [Haloarcula salina]MBV0902850.1 hypothetical protein [Haloarcula salina]